MMHQPFDHHPANTSPRDAEFEAERRAYEKYGEPTTREELLAEARKAKDRGDIDMYYVLMDEASYH